MNRQLLLLVAFLSSALAVSAQVSLTYLDHYQLTPNACDSSGVFCRTFYYAERNRYYALYAGRPSYNPGTGGPMKYFTWREYDDHFNFTGVHGILEGFTSAGDFAIEKIGRFYFHITAAPPWNFKLSKYDEDFNLVDSVTFPLDPSDSQADMLFNYTNGRFIIGALHQQGEWHPAMPAQKGWWTPIMHKWEYDTTLTTVVPPMFLQEIFTAWGASCIFNNNMYHIVTMYKWPNFILNVYRYDVNWNYLDSINLNNDGQWSQGLIWDGEYYYLAYHSGHEHRSGNITLAVYDNHWSLIYDTTITQYSKYIPNSSPPLMTQQYNANRPYLTKSGDTLIVSYDVDDYQLLSYSPPHYVEGNRWQAHVMRFIITRTVGVKERRGDATKFHLNQNYPNPFNPTTTITYQLPFRSYVTLKVFDILGREVRTLADGVMEAGEHDTLFEATDLPNGVYVCRLQTDQFVQQRKIEVVK